MELAEHYFDEFVKSFPSQEGAMYVAEHEGKFLEFIAYVILTKSDEHETPDSNRYGYIVDIALIPSARGKGIAQSLLLEAENYLKSKGVTRVRIGALVMNTIAVNAYQRYGFKPYHITLDKRIE